MTHSRPILPYTLAAFGSSINPTIWGRGIMIDLGLGSLLDELEKRLGLLVANIVAACIALIIFGLVVQVMIIVFSAAEKMIATGNVFGVAAGGLVIFAVFAFAHVALTTMRNKYIMNKLNEFDKEQEEKLQQFRQEREAAKKEHEEFVEKGSKQLAQMKDYNDKLEAHRKDTYG